MKFIGFVGALAFAGMMASTAAQAATPVQTFDTDVTRSNTQQAGAWYTDRYAPAAFIGGASWGGHDHVLTVGIAAAAFQADPFRNTQGRKFDLASDVTQANIELFIDTAFASGPDRRIAGFWGTGFTADGADADTNPDISAYPIIELDRIGGNLVFQGWNTAGGFFTLGTLTSAQVGTWQTLSFAIDGSSINYRAGGFSGSTSASGTTSIGNVIVQAHNTGATYKVHWDNLSTGAVPEPATWAMMIAGFGLTGATLRRRQRKLATA